MNLIRSLVSVIPSEILPSLKWVSAGTCFSVLVMVYLSLTVATN